MPIWAGENDEGAHEPVWNNGRTCCCSSVDAFHAYDKSSGGLQSYELQVASLQVPTHAFGRLGSLVPAAQPIGGLQAK